MPAPFAISEIAKQVGGELRGDAGVMITGVNSIDEAGPGDITFIAHNRFVERWASSRAAAALINKGVPIKRGAEDTRPLITVLDAEIAMIRVLELFQPPEWLPQVGVHAAAFVDPTASLGQVVRIGPHVSVGAGAKIDDGVVLHAGVRLYADVVIGAGSTLHSNVVVRQNCKIGRGVILHQNVSIGADGFNYRPAPNGAGLLKIPHIGDVVLEDGVEIGANSCVDRGKFGSTIIGAGTKIDNLCQIGHNVRIGRCCVIAGCCGLGGSAVLEDGVQLAGQVAVADHRRVGRGARVGAQSLVMDDVPAGGNWLGYPAANGRSVLREWAAIRKLPGLLRKLRAEVRSQLSEVSGEES